MKAATRTKFGSRRGNPAYRTPSSFRYRQVLKIRGFKNKK